MALADAGRETQSTLVGSPVSSFVSPHREHQDRETVEGCPWTPRVQSVVLPQQGGRTLTANCTHAGQQGCRQRRVHLPSTLPPPSHPGQCLQPTILSPLAASSPSFPLWHWLSGSLFLVSAPPVLLVCALAMSAPGLARVLPAPGTLSHESGSRHCPRVEVPSTVQAPLQGCEQSAAAALAHACEGHRAASTRRCSLGLLRALPGAHWCGSTSARLGPSKGGGVGGREGAGLDRECHYYAFVC